MSLGWSLPSSPILGRIYEFTGLRSQDMHGVAREYSGALNREVTYSDIPPEDWEQELKRVGLPKHLTRHLVKMAELNRAGWFDRMADGVEGVTGRPAMSVREFVSLHPAVVDLKGPPRRTIRCSRPGTPSLTACQSSRVSRPLS
jgi:hypothetical protein